MKGTTMLMLTMTALASALIGAILTQHFYTKVLANKSRTHKEALMIEKYRVYNKAFDDGVDFMKEKQHYQRIIDGIAQL